MQPLSRSILSCKIARLIVASAKPQLLLHIWVCFVKQPKDIKALVGMTEKLFIHLSGVTCDDWPYVLHCTHLTVWSQLVPKLHCGETSCVCLYLCSFLSERDIITTTFRSLRYNVHSVGVNIYIQWSKSWSQISTDHGYATHFVGGPNKHVDSSQGTPSLADTELQMLSWTNQRSQLGNRNLCGKTKKMQF